MGISAGHFKSSAADHGGFEAVIAGGALGNHDLKGQEKLGREFFGKLAKEDLRDAPVLQHKAGGGAVKHLQSLNTPPAAGPELEQEGGKLADRMNHAARGFKPRTAAPRPAAAKTAKADMALKQ